jgi:hypothetical protein
MTMRDFSDAYTRLRPNRDAVALLRRQVQECHTELDAAAAGWLQEATLWTPRSYPVRLYVHAVCAEDVTIQLLLRHDVPLFASLLPFAGRPSDRAALREYATAVHAATDAYLAELHPDTLNETVDLERRGVGLRTVAWVITRFVVMELARTRGNIAAETALALG